MSKRLKLQAPITLLRSETEESQLIRKQGQTNENKHPISEIEVKPGDQPHMSLGNFTKANTPKGFSLHINPDPEDDAIITQITRLQSNAHEYELVLHIANYGNKVVSIEVWQLH